MEPNFISNYIMNGEVDKVKEVFKDEYLTKYFACTHHDLLFIVRDVDMVRTLLEYAPIRKECLEVENQRFRCTPLMKAMKDRNWNLVRTLVECGADVNHTITRLNYINSPLDVLIHEMANRSSNTKSLSTEQMDILEYILKCGANPNQPLRVDLEKDVASFTTPFHEAIFYFPPDVLALLLKYGAKVDGTRYDKFNIFNSALDSYLYVPEKLKLLLAHGTKDCIDQRLIKDVLNKQNYELAEIVFAYAKKYQVGIGCTVPQSIVEKESNIKIAKLVVIAFPKWKNGRLRLRYKYPEMRGLKFAHVYGYVTSCGYAPLVELINKGPTLFDILTIQLRYIEIAQ